MTVLVTAPSHESIMRLQTEIESLPQTECPVTHHWADGIYGRETFVPAGTVIVGKMHRDSTLNILVQGEIAVTGAGGQVTHMHAPQIFVSPPLTKKVGFAITDVVWLNVHPTRLQDLAAIESKFIVPDLPAIEE